MKIGKYYKIKYKGIGLYGEGKEKVIYAIVNHIILTPNRKTVRVIKNGVNPIYIDSRKIIDYEEIKDPWNEKIEGDK